jgi:cysteine desulfurase
VQAVGKVPIDLKATEIDVLSLSGHKLHGPKGIVALYVRKGVKFMPLVRGGHQERGRRGGTENAPAIVGLGKAAELALAHMEEERTRVRALRDRLEQGVLQQIGQCIVNGDDENRLPNTSNIAFEYLDGEAILTFMNKAWIAASSGSACTSGSTEPSHVLRAMNLPANVLHGAIRLSFSRDNTSDEVDRVLQVLPEIIGKLRAQSPAAQAHQGAVPSHA